MVAQGGKLVQSVRSIDPKRSVLSDEKTNPNCKNLFLNMPTIAASKVLGYMDYLEYNLLFDFWFPGSRYQCYIDNLVKHQYIYDHHTLVTWTINNGKVHNEFYPSIIFHYSDYTTFYMGIFNKTFRYNYHTYPRMVLTEEQRSTIRHIHHNRKAITIVRPSPSQS
jgi:hypothetical protein